MSNPTPQELRAFADRLAEIPQTAKAAVALHAAARALQSAPKVITAWFMYDRHAFAKIDTSSESVAKARIMELFAEDGDGSLFARDQYDKEVTELILHGGRLADGGYGASKDQVDAWWKTFCRLSNCEHRK